MQFDGRVTEWLKDWRAGDPSAIDRVTTEMYAELRRLASHYLRGESAAHTLQATAVVHEAYLHLEAVRQVDWRERGQFVAVMAQMMRRILVDHARRRKALKRDAAQALALPEIQLESPSLDVLVVDQALARMAAEHPRQAEAVELRFFGGLNSNEIASALDVSLATVERDWRFSKAWLQTELSRS